MILFAGNALLVGRRKAVPPKRANIYICFILISESLNAPNFERILIPKRIEAIMRRREFFKMLGLGAGGILVLPSLIGAAWTETWQAEDAVRFAMAYAQKLGATYTDARIGPGEIQGKLEQFQPKSLLTSDLLGLRICTPAGWRHVVMRDFSKAAIAEGIDQVFRVDAQNAPDEHNWVTAHFHNEQMLAQGSSHPEVEQVLNTAWLRYAQRPNLPRNGHNLLFCDLILAQ
jgi:hypothetical protein